MSRLIIILVIIILLLTLVKSVASRFRVYPPSGDKKFKSEKRNKSVPGHQRDDDENIVDAKYEELK